MVVYLICRANEILAEMKGTFGPHDCKLLCINSSQIDEEILPGDIWTPFVSSSLVDNSSAGHVLGRCLNRIDLEQINEFMQDFSVKNIIPYMEQKIRSLNQQVSATRKGLKNQIKNLWWHKGKDDTADVSNGSNYTFSSIESQIRILGDYALMLRDYELALSNYRLLSSDYKIDKAWKRYAGVQEMIGLSLFMLDQSRKEAEYSMETTFTTYQKIGTSGQRYATRCALWWAELHKTIGGLSKDWKVTEDDAQTTVDLWYKEREEVRLSSIEEQLDSLMGQQKKHTIAFQSSLLKEYIDRAFNSLSPHLHNGGWFLQVGQDREIDQQYMSIPVEIRRVECQLGRIIPCDGVMDRVLFGDWIGERLRVGVLLNGRFLGRHS